MLPPMTRALSSIQYCILPFTSSLFSCFAAWTLAHHFLVDLGDKKEVFPYRNMIQGKKKTYNKEDFHLRKRGTEKLILKTEELVEEWNEF